MNNNTMNSAAVDQAARTLVHTLAAAIAENTDEALRHGYGDLLLIVTDFVTGRGCPHPRGTGGGRVSRHAMCKGRRGTQR
jgi:hypothetical protein